MACRDRSRDRTRTEIYTRFPSGAVATHLKLPADTTYLVLLLHGTRGRDEPTLLTITARFEQAIGDESGTEVAHYVLVALVRQPATRRHPWRKNR